MHPWVAIVCQELAERLERQGCFGRLYVQHRVPTSDEKAMLDMETWWVQQSCYIFRNSCAKAARFIAAWDAAPAPGK